MLGCPPSRFGALATRVEPSPPPNRRGFQLRTVRPRSTSTRTRRPSIFLPSACLRIRAGEMSDGRATLTAYRAAAA
eukprot:scaffold1038_cov122-Isochrysis_galbana.AAC.4